MCSLCVYVYAQSICLCAVYVCAPTPAADANMSRQHVLIMASRMCPNTFWLTYLNSSSPPASTPTVCRTAPAAYSGMRGFSIRPRAAYSHRL